MNTDKKLIIFDFDFTIAKTLEEIVVWSPRGDLINSNNKRYKKVHPTQLQQEGIADDEKITEESFYEFYKLNQEYTQIIKAIFPYLQYYTNEQQVFILTARPNESQNDIFPFLARHNVKIEKIKFIGLKHSHFLKKIEWITQELNKNNYQQLIIFEDNKNLIDYLLIESNIKVSKELYYISNFYNKTVITHYEK